MSAGGYRVVNQAALRRGMTEARAYYGHIDPALRRFLTVQVAATVQGLRTMPSLHFRHPIVGYRRVKVPRFPYLIWYRVDDARRVVVIVGMTHEAASDATIRAAVG